MIGNSTTSLRNNKFYSWVDVGSEYRAPELSSALLYSQLNLVVTKNRELGIENKDKDIINLYDIIFNL